MLIRSGAFGDVFVANVTGNTAIKGRVSLKQSRQKLEEARGAEVAPALTSFHNEARTGRTSLKDASTQGIVVVVKKMRPGLVNEKGVQSFKQEILMLNLCSVRFV